MSTVNMHVAAEGRDDGGGMLYHLPSRRGATYPVFCGGMRLLVAPWR